jgi:hypothetical protein
MSLPACGNPCQQRPFLAPWRCPCWPALPVPSGAARPGQCFACGSNRPDATGSGWCETDAGEAGIPDTAASGIAVTAGAAMAIADADGAGVLYPPTVLRG